MNEPIHNLAYLSRTTRDLRAVELESILHDARAFNAGHEVTGVMFYAKGRFFQFLEGRQEAIAQVMQRVRAAKCHHDIRTILDAPAQERHFDEWHMAFAQPPETELQALENASWDNSIPLTRTSFAKPQGLSLALLYWSRFGAGMVDCAP